MKSRFIILPFIVLTLMILFSGCTDQGSTAGSELSEINNTDDIFKALETGPVFIMIGRITYPPCPACTETMPIVEKLAAEYGDQVKFIYIPTEQQQLVKQFHVQYIPAFFVLVESENDSIIFVNKYGIFTENLAEALISPSFSGQPIPNLDKELTENTLEVTIQYALKFRDQVIETSKR